MADAVYTRSRAKDSENSVAQNGSGGISGPRIVHSSFFFLFQVFGKTVRFMGRWNRLSSSL